MKKSTDMLDDLGKIPIETKKFTRETIVIAAGKSQSLGLGAYDSTVPMPDFDLVCEPQLDDALGTSLERLDIPGKARYIVVYHLHNFSETPCHVTVSLRH